jgi:hypothetical protein
MLPRFIHDFAADFGQLIKADEPFAFVRFHDGEYALIQGIVYDAKSGWSVDGPSWLQFPLRDALEQDPSLDGYYIGISPPSDCSEAASFYRQKVKLPGWRLTFATMFQAANYKKMAQLLRRYENPYVVACKNGDAIVPENGVRSGWDVDALVAKLLKIEGRPIFVAAGPCANVIIHKYWKQQDPGKRVTIIDVGSAIDKDIHGRSTRPVHDPASPERNRQCQWEEWHPFQPLTGKRRELAAQRTAQREVYANLAASGFQGTSGAKAGGTVTVRKFGEGIQSPSVRDRPVTNSGNKNVRILPPKK